ncbi:MAG: SlyX family protein [Gammaproteobacteria bacterium]|nr:SlyX family protein [Gammaproteobacteria bacterium]
MNNETLTILMNKLELVETRQAFQEDTIESLNKEIIQQQQDIKNLEIKTNILEERIKEAASASPETQQEEPPPPHY